MAKLPKEEKEAILASLKAMRSEEVQMAVALEVRRQNNERCTLPVVDNFECASDCVGCVFKKELNPLRGVGGPEGFDEDQLTVRPKGWEPITPYNGRGTPQDSNVIMDGVISAKRNCVNVGVIVIPIYLRRINDVRSKH